MTGYIARSIDRNDLVPELFVEPFAGGASVALAQLHAGLVKKVILNDRDPLVAAFWRTVFFDGEWLIKQVSKIEVTLENWDRFKRQRVTSDRARALKCLYLNRTSFSGVLAPNAGPIGGKAQESDYKIDCRFNKDTIIKRIKQISAYKDRVAGIWNLDWRTAIKKVQKMQAAGSLPRTAFVYLDPPFYNKAKSLYPVHFTHEQHVQLRDFLQKFDEPWILSYDMCEEVAKMYKDGFKACSANLIYTASRNGDRGISKEFIVSNLKYMVSELQLGVGKRAAGRVRISTCISAASKVLDKSDARVKRRAA